MMRPRLDPAETAVRRIAALGYRPADVRHVVLTHLDPDHAGGIADFPGATVHVTAAAYRAATAAERYRYRRRQWAHGTRWRLHEGHGLVRVPGHGRRRGCSDGDVPRWSR
jgi:glyoxylase-like metal-dependent hydrolase (beta-lactamase superfamily II)